MLQTGKEPQENFNPPKPYDIVEYKPHKPPERAVGGSMARLEELIKEYGPKADLKDVFEGKATPLSEKKPEENTQEDPKTGV